jgi:hypothetical protein
LAYGHTKRMVGVYDPKPKYYKFLGATKDILRQAIPISEHM